MKATPYTTKTGIQIGCRYEPRQQYEPSGDMELLQVALIDPGYRPLATVLVDAFLWSLSAAVLVLLIVVVHYA
jgi:hypothetical protein